MTQLDYLCVGHVTRDLMPAGSTYGGPVTYCSRTAQLLGQRAGVVTSAGPDYDLAEALGGVQFVSRPAAETTTFENIYLPSGRRQVVHAVAQNLELADVPLAWREPAILHLAPVANELELDLLLDGPMVCLTPQGWHRAWGADGEVCFARWPAAGAILPRADAVVVSQEDIRERFTWELYRCSCRLLVVTSGVQGCTVYFDHQQRHFPAQPVRELDATGVGDIFATAFFVRLWQSGGDPWEAAQYATRIASPTVARAGIDGLPTAAEVRSAGG